MAASGGAQDDLLTCAVCLGVFEDPVLLGQCGHTYCSRCVRDLPRPLRCPTCRSPALESSILPNFALRALLREREGGGRASVASVAAEGAGSPELAAAAAPAPGSSAPQARSSLCRTVSSERRSDEEGLRKLGVPSGLAKLLLEEDTSIALRIFLLDNSGSTAHPDGIIMAERPDGTMTKQTATRWEEIKQLSLSQANWNMQLGTPCEFVLLNPPARGDAMEAGIDFVRMNPADGDTEVQLSMLAKMLHGTSPKGATPLAERLRKIYARISPQARELARLGQKIVLVIVTDGLPTSGYNHLSGPEQKRDLSGEMRRISQDLPVHLVVRLCTDEEDVVNFYNSIDEEVELQLEVVDDLENEAREVYNSSNRWLVYSPLVHRIREGGTFVKLFDLLDERSLTPSEICLFCQWLLRQNPDDLPLPSEPKEFCRSVRERLRQMPLVYDPIRMRMMPPLIVDELEYAVLPSRFKRMCGAGDLDIGCSVQ